MDIVKINRVDAKGFPVRIRGVVYATQRAAAIAVGVSEKTIRNALDTGTVDLVGKGYRVGGRPGMPCYFRGKSYPSLTAAAKACGVSTAAVSKAVKKHRQDAASAYRMAA